MSHNWQILCFAIGVQCLVFPLANASQAGSCFSSSFSRAIGYILQGFLLGEMEVDSIIECKKRCVLSANCHSVNIMSNSDGSFMCQLNSHLKESGLKEQFVQYASGEYYGLKERKLCEDNGKNCGLDASWFAFNQSYFQLVNDVLAFENARKVCQGMNADLASTSSEEEQAFLYNTFMNPGDTFFVGLNDLVEENAFIWTDGSPNVYARFFTPQPGNDPNSEDCVVISTLENGGYSDVPCDYKYKFLCETTFGNL
ncbi:ladderlectin-like [Dendronephthya gigantea]|uniref:ladderlectin-like n=1 Tax=Dendronephthya gigantea TaxID=151771 RepID=UPI00106B0F73|nr:ladderlectin-like [Dendronephthya gigantea]